MKKLISLFMLFALVTGLLLPLSSSKAYASNNLVSNPSVETVDSSGNLPLNWQSNSWGNLNASFSYPNSGQDGNRSVKVDVSNFQTGDAKWYFNPVAVTANKTYTYRTYYKASVSTEVVMQIKHQDNSISYQWLKTIPSSEANWKIATADYTTPANVSSVTVFHVLASNGWLQTDNTSFAIKDTPVTPTTGNLLPNPSFETADDNIANKPAWWSSGSWGNNTANFSYESNGKEGAHSVKTEVTAFVDGDAKWFVDPVTIKPNQQYNYSQFYKSNIETQVVAVFIDANGNYSYQWLKGVPASSNWAEMTATFKTPTNSQKVSLYQVVDKVGWLQIDQASLTEYNPPVNLDPIPNPSLETITSSNPNIPEGWIHNKWGNNTSVFDYVNGDAHTGTRSVKTTVSNYVDGDAKWYFNPINTLTPGKQYKFSTWYKGNVIPEAVAMFGKADGSTSYIGMPKPLKASSTTVWKHYSESFTVPQDAVSTSVFFMVNKNGWIQTDDYSIKSYTPTGFSRPLVTMTFDDGHEDNVTTTLPLLNQYGFKSTQCYATQFIEGVPGADQNVLAFFNSGHEICSHTITHPFLTTLTNAKLKNELSHSKQVLETIIGQPVLNFASPYGDYNQKVINNIDDYYQSHRTVDEGYNSKDNFNIYRLRVQNVKNTTTLEEYQSWLAQAKSTNTWLILVYHRVANDAGQFDTYPADFSAQLQAISNSGVTVKTYQDALTEVRAQL